MLMMIRLIMILPMNRIQGIRDRMYKEVSENRNPIEAQVDGLIMLYIGDTLIVN
jgi:hypothetical protein